MRKKILFIVLAIILIGFVKESLAQCTPVITVSSYNYQNVTWSPGDPTAFICSGDTCEMSVTPTTGTIQWYKNTSPISGANTSSILVKDAGFYTVTVSGCPVASSPVELVVNPRPVGIISFSPNSPVCEGTSVDVECNPAPGYPVFDAISWTFPPEFNGFSNPFTYQFFNTTYIQASLTVTSTGCTYSAKNTLVVHNFIIPGIITADTIICSGETPNQLSGPSATGGDGIYTYEWQYSIDLGITWIAIPGTNSLTYQPGPLFQTTWFRRVVYSNTPCPAVTQYDPVEITVNENPTVTSTNIVTICSGESVSYTPTSAVSGATFNWTGVNTSGTVTGVSSNGTGSINDILSIPPGGSTTGVATYTITPIGPSPTFCSGIPETLLVNVLPLPIPVVSGPNPVCFGSTGNLYTTEPGMTNYTWTAQGGNIITGHGTNEISVTWTNSGSHWVRVTYTGANGCDALTHTQYNVTVNSLPIPIISGPSTPCLGAPGNVYTTEPGMTNYDWNYSSGATVTSGGGTSNNTVTITWGLSGPQWVSVIYTDINGCTNTSTTQFFLSVSTPTLSGPQSPCLGTSNNVYTTDPGMTNYNWTTTPGATLLSGGTSTSNTATYQWNLAGAQQVSVNYTSSSGCATASPAILPIDVKPLPTPVITGNNSLCQGSTGVVYTTESGKSLYDWTTSLGGTITSGGTPLSSTATVTWHTDGAQEISVNYTDVNGCSAENPTDYAVNVNPQPVPTISGSNSECVTTTGVVYTTESGQSNYNWTVTGGIKTSGAGTNSIVVTWTTVGNQMVEVDYADGNGCNAASPTQYSVAVLVLPVPVIAGSNSVCVNAANVEYTTESGMSGYQWTVPSGGTIIGSSTNENMFVTWNSIGSHSVEVTYTGTNGCDAAIPTTYSVTVNSLPTPTITGSNEVCNNSTGNLYTTQPGMTNYTWVINGGLVTSGGSTSDNEVTITWNTAGAQSVSVNYSQVSCPATLPYVYNVTVNPLPTVSAGTDQTIANGTTTILSGTAGAGTGALTYSWTPLSLLTSGATSLTPTTDNLYATQTFELEVTDTKLCAVTDQMDVIISGNALSIIATATPDEICNNGATVQLNATALGGNSSVQQDYTWTSTPPGFNSNLQNPLDNPTQSTTYHVEVDDGFNIAVTTVVVTVNPLPVQYVVSGGGEYCSGGTGVSIDLDGSESGVNYQLMLNGVDHGTPEAGTGGAISFNNITNFGTYTARAVNSTTTCENNMLGSTSISINPLPTTDAGTDQSIPYGTSTTLSGIASGGTGTLTYQWTPTNMIISGSTTLTPLTENIYATQTYDFTVTDSKLCSSLDQVDVLLLGNALSVTATATPDEICDNGSTTQLNAIATGGNSSVQQDYTWTSTPGTFTSNLQNPVDNPTVTTTYNVEVYDGFNTATHSVIVTVNPLPTVFTVTGGGEYCSGGIGLPVELNGSELGVDYQLLLDGTDDGTPVSGTGSAITFGNKTTIGIYTVEAINTTTLCEIDMTGSVEVIINPLPITYAGDDQTIPHGTSTSLNGSASGGTPPLTYQWIPTIMIASDPTTLAPSTENIYSDQLFDLTVTDSKGCVATDQTAVLINGTALGVVASVNLGAICDGSPAQLSAVGSGGSGTYNYSWTSDQGTWSSNEQNPIVTPSVTTLYTVTIDDGFNTATSSISVTVNPIPIDYLVTGGGLYCSGGLGVEVGLSGSEVGVNYQLYRDGASIGNFVSGTGGAISFGNQLLHGDYTVIGTKVITSCYNQMSNLVEVIILPLPTSFTMTGGGSYPAGGVGVIVGLSDSEIGVNYRLINNSDTLTALPGLAGTSSPIDFGLQTLAGPYTAYAIDIVTGCVINMVDTTIVTINPYPGIFNMYGGDTICSNDTEEIGIDGSEIGVEYTLLRGGFSVISGMLGTGDSISFGDFTISGTYTVIAENILTGLQEYMAGSAILLVEPVPLTYLLSFVQPGDNCLPVVPLLSGSELGIIYTINYQDTSGYYVPGIDTVIGTGTSLVFDTLTVPGIYTASATLDHGYILCSTDMNGSFETYSPPNEYEITPHGTICEDRVELCIVASQPSVKYQLWLNSQPIGNSIPGDLNGGSICFDTLAAPGVYRVHAIDTISSCEIFFIDQLTVNPEPITYIMSPDEGCSGTEITLNGCENGIEYYLYFDPPTRELIEISGPFVCVNGTISFGPLYDEGVYKIKAVDPITNCFAWMDDSTTIYPSPEAFEISPQAGGCSPIEIYMENFELDATYYLYRDNNLVTTDDASDGEVNFGFQTLTGTYTVKAQFIYAGHLTCWSDMTGEVVIYDAIAQYTLMPQDPVCPDVIFYLSGSETGVSYTLWHDLSGTKDTVIGTGSIISFSPQSQSGEYWVVASSGENCEHTMTGVRTLFSPPEIFNMTPIGQFCSNDTIEIGMDSTSVGTIYQLLKSNNAGNPVSEIIGNGLPMSFGSFTNTGIYTVKAIGDTTGCENYMNGELTISQHPNIYHVTANGTIVQPGWYCPPVDIGLNMSQIGIEYTMQMPDGTPVRLYGNGSSLQFGTYSLTGIYDVIAVDTSTQCTINMDGTVSIFEQPEVYDLSSIDNPPIFCEGDSSSLRLMLSYSQLGINYQLVKDGVPVGSPIPGVSNFIIWDSVSQYGGGIYTVDAVFINTPACSLAMNGSVELIEIPLPTASISGYDSICENIACTNMEVLVSGIQSAELVYTDGVTDYTLQLDPTITQHIIQVCPTQNTTYQLVSIGYIDSPYCAGVTTGSFEVIIIPLPVAFAGNSKSTCVSQPILLNDAVASNYSTVYWTIESGSGSLDNTSIVNPTYTPDLLDQGNTVTLKMLITGEGGCSIEKDSSYVTIDVEYLPIAFAGQDIVTCISNTQVDFNDASVQYSSSVLWTHDGAGTLNNDDVINPIYTPDPSDVGNTVSFVLTANGIGDCSSEDSTSIRTVTFDPLPTADAGLGGDICELDFFNLNATASNYDSVLWTITQGAGYFDDARSLITSFYPDNVNLLTIMTVQLTAYGTGGCASDSVYNSVDISVYPAPQVYAGPDDSICEVSAYSLVHATAENAASYTWSTSGSGSFDNQFVLNPTYSPSPGDLALGVIYLILEGETNNSYCSNFIDSLTLTLSEPPVSLFTFNTPSCANEIVYFDDQSTSIAGNIIQWVWDFGDGSNPIIIDYPNNPDTSYLYANGGLYDVSLTALTSLGCPDTSFQQITIIPSIDKSFTISPDDSICLGESFTFNQTGNAVLATWLWNFGDGLTSTEVDPIHTYSSSGVYDVKFTFTDDTGCNDSVIKQASVYEVPDASFSINMSNACVNSSVEFNGSSTATIVSWDWDFGDGQTGNGQNVSHFYTTWGYITVTLTVTDINGCSEIVDNIIYLTQPPIADFTYSSIVCDSLQFTDLSTSAPGYNLVSWDWNFGDGIGVSDLQNPTYQFPSNTTPGGEVYYVSLVVLADSSGFVCSDSIVLPVTVPSLPDIFFTWTQPTCHNDTTYFYGESGFPINYWHWDFGDGNFSNDEYPYHIYSSTGTYSVTLTISDTLGCINSLTNLVTVNPIPTVSFSMSDTTACHGSEIQFISTNSTNVETWYWDFGDGSFSLEDDPIHYFPQGGTYTVTLTVTDSAGCEAEASNQVLILPGATADFTYQNLTCSSVLFQDLSIAPPGYFITNWLWDFGDGFTANVQNPSHSYVTGIGVYDVTLIVTADSSGYSCNDTIVQTIYTPGLPTVFFTWTPEPTMLGNQTDFFGTSGNQITDWYWDFDDGNFATTQDATNTFATVGTFDVELTVTDIDGCQNTILHTVSVTNVPELDYTWNYSCMGEPVQFNVESPPTDIPAVVSWDWDFGDGGISTEMNPLHVYPVAGTYNVSLTIVDTMAATNTIIKQIVVNPLPVALFSIDPLTCAMNDVQFHDLSTTPTGFISQWHWEFGDGNTQTVNFPNDPDIIYQYAAIGTYTVSLTITNSDSCENTTTNDITITASPTAMFTHSEGCESNPFTFTDTSIENGGGIILQWNWDFGDPASGTDNTSTLQNPVHMFSAAGSYDVELMIMNSNGCTDTTTMTVTVEEDPEVEFSWTANCQGEETLFEVDETITNVTEVETFAWTFGDGGTSNLQNPTHIYTVAGDYTVTLMITTTAQCMASVTHTVPINPLPTANFDHDAPACLNQDVEFTDLSSSQNGLIETWEWDFGDGNTTTITAPDNPDVTHLYGSDGNYDVMLTVTDGEGCINEVTKNVEVVSNPIADFNYDETCYNEPVYFTDMSTENGGPDIQSWEWFFGDPASGTNNNSNLQNPTHVFTAPGVYTTTLIIISTMGCSDTTEQDITIDELPLASIGVADDSICLGQLAEFTGTGTNISTWYWEFGDGGTSIDQNPSYMYQSPGEYIVTLTVTGIGTEQCTFTTDTTITVNGAPEAMFEYENTCLGDSTYFTDLSYSQYGFVSQWDWDFGDGNTSTMEDPSHYYLSNDDYEVTLIVTDNYGCSDTIALWVQVYDSPNPSFTWDQVCDPVGQVNYFDESTPGTDGAPIVGWSWELDDGYFSSEIDPSYIYNIIDTCYTVLLTVTDNNGCESTDTNTQVCLHGELEIDFTTTTVCQNQETTFTAIYGPQSDSVASYTWNFNDGSPIEITYYDTIAHIFPQPGMYIVELTAVDTNDCMATIYKEVTVDSLPTAQFTNTIGNCATATEFTDISLGGGEFIENWLWNFGDIASPDNTSTLQNPTHLYGPNDSIYHVKLIVTNFNGCIDSIEQDVYVEPCVVANFELPIGNNCARTELCFTDTSNITSNNNAIDQWRWEFGDGETYNYGDHQNPICHTYEDAGDYDVQLIVVATINGTTYQDTMVHTLTVNPTPLAEIGVTNNCLNDTTRFYDNSTTFGAPILTYEWTFGDETTANDTSSMQDPKYKYPSYGDYITQLIVDNEYGCIDTITDTITVFKLPEAKFSFEELCMSYYTYFTDESIGDSSDIANYYWIFDINQHDTNTSIEPSPVNIYDTAGIYYPRLIVMDENMCKDSIDKVVDIKPIPTSNFMIIDTIQQGNIYLQNLSQDVTGLQDGLTYYWDFDYDYGQSSTEVSPTHQYEVDGNYDVMLVSYNEFNCPDTMHQIYNLLFTNLFVPNAFSPSSALTDLQIFKPTGINIKSYRLEVYSAWGNLVFESTKLDNGAPMEGWDGTYKNKDLPTGSYIWRISAVFEDGEHWKGTDNGDGNSATSGSVTLIR